MTEKSQNVLNEAAKKFESFGIVYNATMGHMAVRFAELEGQLLLATELLEAHNLVNAFKQGKFIYMSKEIGKIFGDEQAEKIMKERYPNLIEVSGASATIINNQTENELPETI